MQLPEPVLWGLKKMVLKRRAFAIALALEGVSVNQAWHPRFDYDPAHRWLRQTLKQVCSVPRQMKRQALYEAWLRSPTLRIGLTSPVRAGGNAW